MSVRLCIRCKRETEQAQVPWEHNTRAWWCKRHNGPTAITSLIAY